MKKVIAIIIGLLPFNKFRIFLWRRILHYSISYSSSIGWANFIVCNVVKISNGRMGHFNRVFCNELIVENAGFGRFNLVKLINVLHLCDGSLINSNNSLVGFYRKGDNYRYKEDCNIFLGKNSLITVRHEFDAARSIIIGENVVFGGKCTQVWTHGFDVYRNMITGRVVIGNDVYVGSRCTICQNVSICDKTVVGAATCVSRSIKSSGFYVSNELIRKADIKIYETSDY